eukprot:229647-Chlamydomonas_euryale.AAC.1
MHRRGVGGFKAQEAGRQSNGGQQGARFRLGSTGADLGKQKSQGREGGRTGGASRGGAKEGGGEGACCRIHERPSNGPPTRRPCDTKADPREMRAARTTSMNREERRRGWEEGDEPGQANGGMMACRAAQFCDLARWWGAPGASLFLGGGRLPRLCRAARHSQELNSS